MNKELLENLQDKTYVRAFGLMSPEEQECYKKATKGNCEIYIYPDWISQTAPNHTSFNFGDTYAIKPDYQPEPEHDNLEIKEVKEMLGTYEKGIFKPLYCLPSLPKFEGFWVDENPIPTDYVARNISLGKTVYARFRR